MNANDPGTGPGERPGSRRLAQPPSTRYESTRPAAGATGAGTTGAAGERARSALIGPLLRADVVALLGAAALVLVGAVFASTFGLLFVAGVMGTVIGLVLARAAVPGGGAAPVPRALVVRVAIALSLVAVVVADVGTWLYARGEGGTLGPLDYLLETFGPFVPGVAIVAAVTAWWGATSGPVQR